MSTVKKYTCPACGSPVDYACYTAIGAVDVWSNGRVPLDELEEHSFRLACPECDATFLLEDDLDGFPRIAGVVSES